MTTFIVYADAADGKIDSTNAAYATARSGGSFAVDTTTANGLTHGQQEFFGYDVIEGFVGFDTSVIGAAPIASVVLSLYGAGALNTAGWTSQARLSNWGPTVTSADFIAGASLSALTLLATRTLTVVGDWSTTGYNDYTSDANFLTNINGSGTTYLLLCSSKTVANTAPGAGLFENAQAFQAEQTGTVNDPRLVVTTTDYAALPPPAIRIPNPMVGPMALRNLLRPRLRQIWQTVSGSTTKNIPPDAVSFTSSVVGDLDVLKNLAAAAVAFTSAVSAGVVRLRPIPANAVTFTTSVSGEIQELQNLAAAAVAFTTAVSAGVTRLRRVPPDAVTFTTTVSAGIVRLRPVPPNAVTLTTSISGEIQELQNLAAAAVTFTTTVSGAVSGTKPITPAAVTFTTSVAGEIQELQRITASAVTFTTSVSGIVTDVPATGTAPSTEDFLAAVLPSIY